ncbi:hypothetical protein JOC75_001716 [Metabacillus crassostreae]|uniref:hypothetical protein n=1 Tax=Metabacillus crassostreae TaxID=929098 RepID=UPI00195BE558|nr:hypothetical protein [Metabacillus crassostreae]MBM7603743.1 hypothetical protein [Metabacillus crassostreae]
MYKYPKIILTLMMIVPWFSLAFFGKKAFKRFLPASLFISLVVKIECYIAKKRKWWWFYEELHPKLSRETPLIIGPFFVGSLWILKLTYGKFKEFIVFNLLIDSFFTYYLMNVFQKLGLGSLVRLKRLNLSLLFLIKSLLLYAFQYVKDRFIEDTEVG